MLSAHSAPAAAGHTWPPSRALASPGSRHCVGPPNLDLLPPSPCRGAQHWVEDMHAVSQHPSPGRANSRALRVNPEALDSVSQSPAHVRERKSELVALPTGQVAQHPCPGLPFPSSPGPALPTCRPPLQCSSHKPLLHWSLLSPEPIVLGYLVDCLLAINVPDTNFHEARAPVCPAHPSSQCLPQRHLLCEQLRGHVMEQDGAQSPQFSAASRSGYNVSGSILRSPFYFSIL